MTRLRTNSRVQAALTALMVLAAMAFPLAGAAVANHGSRTLEVTPETTNRGVGTVHTLTATLSSPADLTSGTIQIDFENEDTTAVNPTPSTGGPNDPDDSETPQTPDMSCSIPSGSSSCQINYVGNTTGTDQWRAWIDHDGLDGSQGGVTEADMNEQADAGGPPDEPGDATGVGGTGCGSPAGPVEPPPDCTDVVRVTWEAGAPATLDCDDASGPNTEQETNPSGGGNASNETYTCTVRDAHGNATSDFDPDATGEQPTMVFGENENGVNDPDTTDGASYDSPDYECTAGEGNNADGVCTISVTQNENEQGTAEICFWADDDDPNTPGGADGPNDGDVFCANELTNENAQPNGSDTGNDLADQVEKTWAQRAASGVDAEPESDQNDTGQTHNVTVTVYDQFGQTFTGNTQVRAEFFQGSPSDSDGNTPASPDEQCTTNNSSTCTIDWTSANPGKDLLCVWVGTNPSMQGNNTNGTCDGEGLSDPDDASGSADAPEPETDDVDVVEKNWNNPNAATRLDCEPETDSNPTGTAHTITCTARNSSNATVSGAKIDMEATGANDPDGNAQLTNPDFSCTTGNDGTCSMTHGSGGTGTTNNPGTTTYRAWIDQDDDNTSTEADETEGRDEAANAGSNTSEPDGTDVMEKTWTGGPANLTMEPASDTASVGTCNAFTITVTDQANQTVSGVTIDVEQRHANATNQTANDEPTVSFCTPTAQDGPNPSNVDETKGDLRPPDETPDNPGTAGGETTGTTNSAGKITIGIRVAPGNGSDGTGNVTVEAFFDASPENDDPDASEPKDTSTKTWVVADARTLNCEPETSNAGTNQTQTITCTALDRFGAPVQGEVVNFTTSGVGSVNPASASTNAQGQATTTASSTTEGTQTVTGTLADDTTGSEPGEVDECDKTANDPSGSPAGACSDDVTVNWTEPQETQCSDGVDNDGDGQVDFGQDPGCDNAQDDTEGSEGSETFKFDSSISIRYRKGDFKGRVTTTGDARCISNRRVKLFKVRDGKDKVVGRDRTNDNGRWRVEKQRARGRFYAKVLRREITLANGDVIICQADRSRRIKR